MRRWPRIHTYLYCEMRRSSKRCSNPSRSLCCPAAQGSERESSSGSPRADQQRNVTVKLRARLCSKWPSLLGASSVQDKTASATRVRRALMRAAFNKKAQSKLSLGASVCSWSGPSTSWLAGEREPDKTHSALLFCHNVRRVC